MIRLGNKKSSHRRFGELPLVQRIGVAALAVVQIGLLAAAERDIQRRPAAQIVGRKLWWRAVCLINFVGPLSYFRWGRSTQPLEREPTAQSFTG